MIQCPHLRLTKSYSMRFKSCLQWCQSTLNPPDFLSKKSEPNGQFLNLTRARTNLTYSKSNMLLVLPNKKAIVCTYHIIFLSYRYQNVMLLAFIFSNWWYTMQRLWTFCCCIHWVFEWLTTSTILWNYLPIPSHEICFTHMELWDFKGSNCYVSNNEDPQRTRPKKAKFIALNENVMITTID